MQGSTQPRRTKHCQLQERRHLAATTHGPTHTGTPRAADHTDVGLTKCKLCIGLRATVGPLLAITHRRQARRLRLQPRQQNCRGEAEGRSEIGRDGAWVRRISTVESSRSARRTRPHIFEGDQSGDTVAAHNQFHQVQGAQMRVQCFSEEKARQLPRIGRTGPPDTQYVRTLGKIFEAGGQPVKNREMRSLAQKGNQAKFFHRMPGMQRSPVVYNFQHLREYNSC